MFPVLGYAPLKATLSINQQNYTITLPFSSCHVDCELRTFEFQNALAKSFFFFLLIKHFTYTIVQKKKTFYLYT